MQFYWLFYRLGFNIGNYFDTSENFIILFSLLEAMFTNRISLEVAETLTELHKCLINQYGVEVEMVCGFAAQYYFTTITIIHTISNVW